MIDELFFSAWHRAYTMGLSPLIRVSVFISLPMAYFTVSMCFISSNTLLE